MRLLWPDSILIGYFSNSLLIADSNYQQQQKLCKQSDAHQPDLSTKMNGTQSDDKYFWWNSKGFWQKNKSLKSLESFFLPQNGRSKCIPTTFQALSPNSFTNSKFISIWFQAIFTADEEDHTCVIMVAGVQENIAAFEAEVRDCKMLTALPLVTNRFYRSKPLIN